MHVHVIFSTKDRQPWIDTEWRGRLHAYLGGAFRDLNVFPEAIGGVADHVHALIGLQAVHRLSDVMRDIKRPSSEWVHRTIGLKEFQWQEGYGAFTVSPSSREDVRRYIARQEEHHRKKSFQEEYREFLAKCEVEYDARFVD
ncbi:hypothetical protein llg_13810 [Luteolibacter sp. LG18]|nr:hypothetical protein llg_13810 [Luteolibacter sp. LG18]